LEGQVTKEKSIFVATKVKSIHPGVDVIVKNLYEIDLIQYVRVSQEDVQASNEIKIKGRMKIPVSTTDYPSVVGVQVVLNRHFLNLFTNVHQNWKLMAVK